MKRCDQARTGMFRHSLPPRFRRSRNICLPKKTNLMTRILVAASLVVVVAFAGFSLYIDSLQRGAVADAVKHNIESSGKQAAQSISNWLNGRVMLTDNLSLIHI